MTGKSLREIEDELIALGFPIVRHDDPPLPVGCCGNCHQDLLAHLGRRLPRGCPGWRQKGT